MSKVYATRACVITHQGVPTVLREGQPFDGDDPLVRDHPELFDSPVEEATARPGERRNVRHKS